MGHGHFSGEPEAVWLTEDGTPDRRMKILHDFSFTDPRSRVWEAPAGSIERAGPRTRRTAEERQLEKDFQRISDQVLARGETDDPEELERRADTAMAVVAGLRIAGRVRKRPRRAS